MQKKSHTPALNTPELLSVFDNSSKKIEKKALPQVERYAINLMWINERPDEIGDGAFVCLGKSFDRIDYIASQLKKWVSVNPEAQVNFWYDSTTINPSAVETTQLYLEAKSGEIQLRDIREIPFIQMNSQLFSCQIPVYFRIDFLKLIISLHQFENEMMDSVIYTDLSIGDQCEEVLSKSALYSELMLDNLQKYGMMLGSDGASAENQFVQMLNTPELIISLKHAINCCLNVSISTLNFAIETRDASTLRYFYYGPFIATLVHVRLYLAVIKTQQPVKIRADIVGLGDETEWVDYQPEAQGYLMFGNFLNYLRVGNLYRSPEGNFLALEDIVCLPEGLEFKADAIRLPDEWDSCRKDLNPGHHGQSHPWDGAVPGFEYPCQPVFWPVSQRPPAATKSVGASMKFFPPKAPASASTSTTEKKGSYSRMSDLD